MAYADTSIIIFHREEACCPTPPQDLRFRNDRVAGYFLPLWPACGLGVLVFCWLVFIPATSSMFVPTGLALYAASLLLALVSLTIRWEAAEKLLKLSNSAP